MEGSVELSLDETVRLLTTGTYFKNLNCAGDRVQTKGCPKPADVREQNVKDPSIVYDSSQETGTLGVYLAACSFFLHVLIMMMASSPPSSGHHRHHHRHRRHHQSQYFFRAHPTPMF